MASSTGAPLPLPPATEGWTKWEDTASLGEKTAKLTLKCPDGSIRTFKVTVRSSNPTELDGLITDAAKQCFANLANAFQIGKLVDKVTLTKDSVEVEKGGKVLKDAADIKGDATLGQTTHFAAIGKAVTQAMNLLKDAAVLTAAKTATAGLQTLGAPASRASHTPISGPSGSQSPSSTATIHIAAAPDQGRATSSTASRAEPSLTPEEELDAGKALLGSDKSKATEHLQRATRSTNLEIRGQAYRYLGITAGTDGEKIISGIYLCRAVACRDKQAMVALGKLCKSYEAKSKSYLQIAHELYKMAWDNGSGLGWVKKDYLDKLAQEGFTPDPIIKSDTEVLSNVKNLEVFFTEVQTTASAHPSTSATHQADQGTRTPGQGQSEMLRQTTPTPQAQTAVGNTTQPHVAQGQQLPQPARGGPGFDPSSPQLATASYSPVRDIPQSEFDKGMAGPINLIKALTSSGASPSQLEAGIFYRHCTSANIVYWDQFFKKIAKTPRDHPLLSEKAAELYNEAIPSFYHGKNNVFFKYFEELIKQIREKRPTIDPSPFLGGVPH